jgi:putative MATE family efflux protein
MPETEKFPALIKEALFGSKRVFTAISINHAIILLAMPMVLEMAMESLFGIVDIFFVAHLGADATATVGITEGMLVLVSAISLGLGMATTAIIARRTGENDRMGASQTAMHSILIGTGLAVMLFAFCLPFAPELLALMGASPSILNEGSVYARIMMSSSGIVLMLFVINAIFRGAGDASIAMRVLWIANFINLCLDPCLILGLGPFPRMGLTGAAVATTTGRSVGILMQIYFLRKAGTHIKIAPQSFRINFRLMARIFRIAMSGSMQFVISTASWIVMVRLVQSFGSAATAGCTVAIRIVLFSLLPSWGLGSAAATLVGQHLGARQPEQAARSVWRAGFFNMLFLGALSLLLVLYSPEVVGIFTDDSLVKAIGADCLRIISVGYILFAYGMVILQGFNGAGDTFTPLWINVASYWAIQLPLSFLLAQQFRLGPQGVFLAMLIAGAILSLISIYLFRRGSWKEQTV